MTDYVQKSVLVARYYLASTSNKPGSVAPGTEVYETDTGIIKVWTGTAWVTKTSGTTTATISGTSAVAGSVASGSADSGNPVKTGGKYNATNITVADGQRVDDQSTVNGFKRMDLGTLIAGENLTLDRLIMAQRWNYTAITTQTTTVVKGTAGTLGAIIINKSTASGVIKIDDAASDTTPILGTITNPGTLVAEGPMVAWYNAIMTTGITIVTSGANQDITVLWL